MLFLLKVTITPVLVALMSLAARRWGPTLGGIIMGLPWMTGPILLFLGLEQGNAYVARASTGTLVGSIAIGAYLVAYAGAARRTSWPVSLCAAVAAYAAVGYAASGIGLSLWVAGAAGTTSLLAAYLSMPRVADAGGLRYLPWWDIPMRMAATAALVAIITLAADALGPELSGVVASYPVIVSIICAFTHSQWGWAAFIQLARGVALSLLSFVAFFLVLGSQVERLGLAWSFALAAAAALAISSGLILASKVRARSAAATRPTK